MEKNKGLFSFRKHPVGDFPDGEKGRKRKGGRLRQSMGFLLAAALVFNTLPASGLAVSASGREVGLCEHHRSHTADCGYMEAQPCTHEHTEECYTTVTECVHEHTDECYPETEETEESAGEGNATASDAEGREPENCTHKCSEESGCITKVLDCHHEHDESCGYNEAQECSYVCEICNGTESEDTGENTENTEDAGTNMAKCICEILCTEDSINGDCPVCGAEDADLSGCVGKETVNSSEEDVEYDNAVTDMAECICKTLCTEDSINGDCPICSVEDADLFHCKGEKTEEQEKTGEKVITAWEWIDPEEYLTDGMLALPGAGRENPAFMEAVTALLPEKIQAEVVIVNAAKNGEETEEDAEAAPETEDAEITLTGWGCASYPKDGAYEGAYIFTAFLPEGFVLTEDAAALEVKVELGGAEMLLRGEVSAAYQEASWNGSEVTYTGKTENCTVVESNTEAVTWNAGWYVVNSTVTISEPVTVNGAVNLILADGCTLTAEKGIVVTDGNSLTIYAQSGGTGTLTATGTTDSGNNASAGIGGSIASVDSGAITIHGGMINTTGGGQSGYYGGAGIGGGTLKSGNGGNSGAVIIYGGTVTANSGAGELAGAGIGGGSGSGSGGGTSSNITIYGGSVIANSTGTGTGGAGIGGGGGLTSGGAGNNIQICGGTINATGNSKGAGIGGGGGGSGDKCTSGDGTVTISGGIVTAVGGSNAAGIGGGGGYKFEYAGTVMTNITGGAGTVTISGGIVDAKNGGSGDPIGNGGNTTAQATVSKENAIVFENGVGTVVGNVTFDGSYEVPTGCSLNIPDGATLSGTGTLSGGGTFTIENLTEDMISVPDIHYTSEDMTEKIKEKVTISGKTVCGQTFMVDMDSWILNVAKVSDMEYTATYTHTEKGTVSKTVTILPCIHNNGEALTHHEGREADCTQTGVKEYWDCSICGKNFSDKDGKTEITDTELPIAAHTLIHHDRVEADCTQTGVKEYWGCSVCGKKFSDQNGQTEITDINIPVTAHTLTHHEGQEANCTAAGNKEYWDCSVCGKKFSDQNGQTEIADADIIIPVKTHTLTHHARQEADCLTDGTIEYWSCDVCNKLFADSDGKKEVTDIKVSAKGHDYGAWGSNGNGTHTHSCKTPGCGFTETEDCFGGTATYTEKAVCTVCGDKYGELLQDVGAPTGEISIGTNKWNSFLNKITFGLFFKKTEQVTITAQDNESGVASVSYYISDSELTEEEVKKLDNWTAGNTDKTTFRISQDKSCVVYAKITDKQGNVTYISSDGLVFDGTSPSITGIADGEIYCTSQEVVVTDNNSESVTVTVNGKEQTLSDSKFTLDVKFDTTPMIITATDKAGNVTTVTVYVGHNYGTDWKSDSNGHWQECAVCGNKSEVLAHTWDSGTVTVKPTTESEGEKTFTCTVCGRTKTETVEKLPESHTHSYGTEWKSDSNSHWHECSCGEKSDTAAHTWDNGTVTVKPTTDREGEKTYTCTVCGKTKTETVGKLPPSHTHNYGTDWKSDNSNHWHECSCGEKSGTAAHTWDSGRVTVQPTTDKEGEKTFTCTVCGRTKTETVGKLPQSHTHSYGTEWKSDNNNHWHECDCGEKNSIAVHTWDSGRVTVQPTTDKEGEKTFTCTVCGRTKTETVGKLPQSHTHSYGTNWKSDSNSHWHECTCGEKNSIAAHTWDSGTVTVKPTTDREGEKIFTCMVCGRTKTETVGKLSQSHTESSQPGDKKPDNSNQQNNGNTEDTKVDTGIPFIKDEDGKNGWNVIRTEEEKAEEGSIINVDMNGSTVVPGDIFDSIKGRDITITFDMGNGIIWSVNGKSITTDKADDINFSIKTGTNAIPVDIVNNITGERYSIQLSLSHEGEFGFTAILSINLGKDNAGLTANLYYYNESTGELEFICADTVAEDGMVSLAFTHASDYAVVIDADSMEQETGAGSTAEAPKTGEESTSADTTDTSVKNDLWNRIWVFVLCGVLVVAGLGIFFVGRKKNSKG